MTEAFSVVSVGLKPLMNYVTGLVVQFTKHNAQEITVRARGKFISKAVDIVQVAGNRFLKDSVQVKDIKIGSEAFTTPEGRQVRVSTIAITLSRTSAPLPAMTAHDGDHEQHLEEPPADY